MIKTYDVGKNIKNMLYEIDRGGINSTEHMVSSNYYVFAEDERANELCICLNLEITYDGNDQWYSIHVIDDINAADCELYCTEHDSIEELKLLIHDIVDNVLTQTTERKEKYEIEMLAL